MQRVLGRPFRYYAYRLVPVAGALLLIAAIIPADLTAGAHALNSMPTRAPAVTEQPAIAATVPAPAVVTNVSVQAPAKIVTASLDQTPKEPWLPNGAWEVDTLPAGVVPPGTQTQRIGSIAVNIRAEPSSNSARLGVLTAGTVVQVAETSDGWVHVYADGQSGWIYSSYIEGARPATAAVAKDTAPSLASKTIRFRSAVAVQSGPNGAHVYDLEPGERVSVAEQKGSWLRIVTADGESGWIRIR